MGRVAKILVLFATCLMVNVGCGVDEESPTEPRATGEIEKYGELLLSYSQTFDPSEEGGVGANFQVRARFWGARDVGSTDVRALLGEEPPSPGLEPGQCEPGETDSEVGQRLVDDGALLLLDAGELTLQADAGEVPIPSWSFPSVYGVVAGVLYGGDQVPLELHPGSVYRVVASGSDELGAFSLSLVAPEPFSGVTVGGVDPSRERVPLESGHPLAIRWEPGQVVDEVLIEVGYRFFGAPRRVLCSSLDDGFEMLPSSVVDSLLQPGVTEPRITLMRIARTSFEAEGLDEGEGFFMVSATASLGEE